MVESLDNSQISGNQPDPQTENRQSKDSKYLQPQDSDKFDIKYLKKSEINRESVVDEDRQPAAGHEEEKKQPEPPIAVEREGAKQENEERGEKNFANLAGITDSK